MGGTLNQTWPPLTQGWQGEGGISSPSPLTALGYSPIFGANTPKACLAHSLASLSKSACNSKSRGGGPEAWTGPLCKGINAMGFPPLDPCPSSSEKNTFPGGGEATCDLLAPGLVVGRCPPQVLPNPPPPRGLMGLGVCGFGISFPSFFMILRNFCILTHRICRENNGSWAFDHHLRGIQGPQG